MKGGRVVEVKAPQKGLFDQALSEYKKYRAILIVAFVVAIAESILRSLSLPLTTIYYITHFLGFASVALAIWIFVEERNYASKFQRQKMNVDAVCWIMRLEANMLVLNQTIITTQIRLIRELRKFLRICMRVVFIHRLRRSTW